MLIAASMLAGTMLFGGAGSSYAAVPAQVLAEASQMKNASISNLDNDTPPLSWTGRSRQKMSASRTAMALRWQATCICRKILTRTAGTRQWW